MKSVPWLPALPALLLLGGGCATRPFPPVATVPPGDGAQAGDWRRSVAETTPHRFTVSGSTVFEYRGRALTALSATRIDETDRSFSVVALSPVGVKLFEIEGRAGEVTRSVLAPGLDERGDPSKAIAKDVERVYFDRVPSIGASARLQREGFLFTETTAEGRIEHLLGGAPPVLLEKRFRDARGIVWSATYHEYAERDGQRYPCGIVYRHRRHGYRIILRIGEIHLDTTENGIAP